MLKILGRHKLYYIRLRAEKTAMVKVHDFLTYSLGSDDFGDEVSVPDFEDYDDWRDLHFYVDDLDKGIEIEMICGFKVIHLFVRKCDDWEFFNEALLKHAEWVEYKPLKKK